MAITFLEEKKRQRYLVIILALTIFVILIIIWQGFLKTPETTPSLLITPSSLPMPPKIIINWQVLEDPKLAELQEFQQIKPFEGEIGRKNPFISY